MRVADLGRIMTTITHELARHRLCIADHDVTVHVRLSIAEHEERSEHFGCPVSESIAEVTACEVLDWECQPEPIGREVEDQIRQGIEEALGEEYGDATIQM
jgi:hypothetical protein